MSLWGHFSFKPSHYVHSIFSAWLLCHGPSLFSASLVAPLDLTTIFHLLLGPTLQVPSWFPLFLSNRLSQLPKALFGKQDIGCRLVGLEAKKQNLENREGMVHKWWWIQNCIINGFFPRNLRKVAGEGIEVYQGMAIWIGVTEEVRKRLFHGVVARTAEMTYWGLT